MALQPTYSSPGGMKDLSLLASHENDESPLFAEIPMPNERAAAAHCLKCVFFCHFLTKTLKKAAGLT